MEIEYVLFLLTLIAIATLFLCTGKNGFDEVEITPQDEKKNIDNAQTSLSNGEKVKYAISTVDNESLHSYSVKSLRRAQRQALPVPRPLKQLNKYRPEILWESNQYSSHITDSPHPYKISYVVNNHKTKHLYLSNSKKPIVAKLHTNRFNKTSV